jgi:DNA polymerase-3 subunit delta'
MEKGNFIFNWPLVGNRHITECLEKIIQKDEIRGPYIFNGPDNLGKTTIARHFAQILLCQNKDDQAKILPCGKCPSCYFFANHKNASPEEEIDEDAVNSSHGDFHIIKRGSDKKNISVEQIREFIRSMSMSSFLGNYKIGIIKHAENLSNEAANALLKTLEEPRDKVIIILIASELESLPATIVSRSQILNFYPIAADIIYDDLISRYKASRSEAKNFSRMSLGRPAIAVKFLEDKNFYQEYNENVKAFLEFVGGDINNKFFIIEKLIDKKAENQASARTAKRILSIWQSVTRDWLLLKFGHENLVQHMENLDEIKKRQNNFTLPHLISLDKNIKQAIKYINANVTPRLAFESIAVEI